MKRTSHNSVTQIKRLLDPIPMMHININIQHSIMVLQQLQNPQHNIIHITKPRRFALLRMMQASRPVNAYIRPLRVQIDSSIDASPARNRAELIQPVKDRAVIDTQVEHLHYVD